MNALGTLLIWTGLQVTAFCSIAGAWYLAARRLNPAWRAAVLCGALVSTFAIALFAASPWPRWWSLPGTRSAGRPSQQPSGANPTPLRQSASMRSPAPSESDRDVKRAELPFRVIGFLSAMWDGVGGRPVAQHDAHVSDLRWRWPAWLAVTILMGIGIGLARVLLGWLALRRLLRGTRQVTDASLVSLADELRGKLRCRKPIELREMATAGSGGSPAVVGWRRPVIVLPAGWRSWSADARQGILAHETAHVARGDFLMWLVAQSGVILNFYNPLVHWLARRLRLEQELAADACGAALAGGAKAYAVVLARMALEQDDFRPLWAGRPFFPTHGTLMRRIEMLHHQPLFATRMPSRLGVAASLAALALIAIAVTGLRAPAGAAHAAETAAETATETPAPTASQGVLPTFDRSYLPADAIAAVSIKPMSLANSKSVVRPTLMHFPQANGFAFGLSEKALAWEIEEVTAIGLAPAQPSPEPAGSSEPPFVGIYRMRQPYDRGKLRAEIFGEAPDGVTETTCHGHDCFSAVSEMSGDLINYLLVDDRTFVVIRDRDLPRVLAANPANHPAWYGEWQKIAGSPMAVALDSAALAAVDTKPTDDPQEQFYLSMLHTTALIFAHVDSAPDGLTISASAQCKSPEQAITTTQFAKAGMAGLATALTEPPQILEASILPPEYQALDVARAVVKTLSELKLDAHDTRVTVEAKFEANFVAKFAEATNALLARQTEEYKARVKADGPVHIEKLGRLADAFSAYHAAHGHYPPAAVAGPGGTTVHSWRVALLPYLGEQELFDDYNLEEPWDSEHNKQLIEKIPEIYSTTEASKKGNSDYFVVTGKGTLFDGAAFSDRESITDAPGDTIVVLQSFRHTPWTKPADIDHAANLNEVRQLRGFYDGFYAAFADGTVRLVPTETAPATIRAMFTKAGGDEVKLR